MHFFAPLLLMVLTSFLSAEAATTNDDSEQFIDFSSLLYSPNSLSADASSLSSSALQLRSLDEITSTLLAHRSLLSTRDSQYNTLLSTLIHTRNNISSHDLSFLISFIKEKSPHKTAFYGIIHNALFDAAEKNDQEGVDLALSLFEQEGYDLSKVSLYNLIALTADEGHQELLLYLVEKYSHLLEYFLVEASKESNIHLITQIITAGEHQLPLPPSMIEKALAKASDIPVIRLLFAWCEEHNYIINKSAIKNTIEVAITHNEQELTDTLLAKYPSIASHALQAAASKGNQVLINSLLTTEKWYVDITPVSIEKALQKALHAYQRYKYTPRNTDIPVQKYEETITALLLWCEEHKHALNEHSVSYIVKKAAQNEDNQKALYFLHHFPYSLQNALAYSSSKGYASLLHLILSSEEYQAYLTPLLLETSLIHASRFNHDKIVKILLGWCDQHNYTLEGECLKEVIRYATYNSNHTLTHSLLERFPQGIPACFIWASQEAQLPLVEAFLTYDKYHDHITPLIIEEALLIASRANHKEIITTILAWYDQHTPPLQEESLKEIIESAASHSNLIICGSPLESLLRRFPHGVETTLLWACRNNSELLIKELLTIDDYQQHLSSHTVKQAMNRARQQNHSQIIKLLTEWERNQQPSWYQRLCSCSRKYWKQKQ